MKEPPKVSVPGDWTAGKESFESHDLRLDLVADLEPRIRAVRSPASFRRRARIQQQSSTFFRTVLLMAVAEEHDFRVFDGASSA